MSREKSTLKSFSFGSYKGVDELPDVVVELFTAMTERPEKSVEYAEEIINAGLEGRIDFDREFNLDAYEYRVRNTTYMNVEKTKRKVTFFHGEDIDDTHKGGVSENKVSDDRDDYANIDDEDEVKWAVNNIKAENNTFRVDYGINLIKLLRKGIEGYPQATERLRMVCKEFERVGEWIKIILSSGYSVDLLFSDSDAGFSVLSEERGSYVVVEKEVVDEVRKAVEETEVIELVSDNEKKIIEEEVDCQIKNTPVVDITEIIQKSRMLDTNEVSDCLTVDDVSEKDEANVSASERRDNLIVYCEDNLIQAVNKYLTNITSFEYSYSMNRRELLTRSILRYPKSTERLHFAEKKFESVSKGINSRYSRLVFFPDKDNILDYAEVRINKEKLSPIIGLDSSNRCRAVTNRAIPMYSDKELLAPSAFG